MKFEKGRLKTGGRRKGALNRDTTLNQLEALKKKDKYNLTRIFSEAINSHPKKFLDTIKRLGSASKLNKIMEILVYRFVKQLVEKQEIVKWEFVLKELLKEDKVEEMKRFFDEMKDVEIDLNFVKTFVSFGINCIQDEEVFDRFQWIVNELKRLMLEGTTINETREKAGFKPVKQMPPPKRRIRKAG